MSREALQLPRLKQLPPYFSLKKSLLGTKDAKTLFKTIVALWMINKAIPFSMVEKPIFCNRQSTKNQL
jgi:hypothetical protein